MLLRCQSWRKTRVKRLCFLVQAEALREPEQAAHLGGAAFGDRISHCEAYRRCQQSWTQAPVRQGSPYSGRAPASGGARRERVRRPRSASLRCPTAPPPLPSLRSDQDAVAPQVSGAPTRSRQSEKRVSASRRTGYHLLHGGGARAAKGADRNSAGNAYVGSSPTPPPFFALVW